MNNTSKVLFGIAAGVAAGAILGILFAPDKGSEIRRKIADQKNKLADEIKNKFSECKGKCNDLKEDVENKVKEFA